MTDAVEPAPIFTLPWSAAPVEGALRRRYHRFLADVTLDDGRAVTAHCVNSGTMEGLVIPGARVWLVPADNPKRTLRWTWIASACDGRMVGVDTLAPNRLVRAMLTAHALPGVDGYDAVRPEFVHAPGSRVDFRLDGAAGPHDLEVKNCHLVYPDGVAYFPDSVSERATKHLQTLARESRKGITATVVFVVQRDDARLVRPSDLHDPEFARAARRAAAAGVRFVALRVRPTPAGLSVLDAIPVDLARYDTAPMAAWRAAAKPRSGWERPPRAAKP